jgi:hypothetical protein
LQEDSSCREGGIHGQKKEGKNGGNHLGYRFMFTDFFCGKNGAFLSCDEANSRDEEFASNDQGDKPDGEQAGAEKANEGDGDEEFVGKGIEETAEVGLDLPFPCEVAIEPIGKGGGDKQDEGEPSGPRWNGWAGTGLKKDEQDEGGDDSGYG